MTTFREYFAKKMDDPDFRKGVEELEPEYTLVRQLIQARKELNLTQQDLAERVGTKQGNISRLERGNANPSLLFLKKIANILGRKLTITLEK
ncbi:MAG: helix-turn-helix transcriptional regulator [Planctomycetia bacterium]|nr:helix-turn-helix transcriptional regulator [Planctomycetia bacterium]